MALKENKIYRAIIIPLCIALSLCGRFIPLPPLSSDAVGVIFIFLSSLILWLTIGIDWPSILCLFSLMLLDNVTANSVFTSSFGNATFVFLLFTFVCTYALSQTCLIKKIAIAFINNKVAKKSGFLFVLLFLSAVLLLGLFISPTVLFVIILPILEEIFHVAQIDKGDRIGKTLLIGLGFTVSISSGMTPIAHVFPVLAMSNGGINVDPLTYMAFAIPSGLIIFILMYLMLIIFMRPEVNKLKNLDVSSIDESLPKIGRRDIATLTIFIFVILLWIIPSLFENISPAFYQFFNQYGTAMPPLLGTILLCIIRIDHQPLVKIDEALKKGVPWSSLIMCAATLALGAVLMNNDIGIKTFLQNNIGEHLMHLAPFVILLVFVAWAAIQTNVSSNMVTATLVATVASAVLGSAVIDLNTSVVICIIGMMASFAFATPPSMPHIAIVASSEYGSTKDVLLYGGLLMIIAIIVACFVSYPLGCLFI